MNRRRATHGQWGPGRPIRVGKVADDTIVLRAKGNVEIWSGDPGAENDSNVSQQFVNQCPQTLTKNCWVALVGNYIVEVINPALFITVQLAASAPIAIGGLSYNPSILSYFNGANPAGQLGMQATLTSGGGGYTSPPTVSFSGGGGTGAGATCVINALGVVTSITITANGSGYTSAPTISFSGGGGSGAAATAGLGGVSASPVQGETIAGGSLVIAVWNDVGQAYVALDWECQT